MSSRCPLQACADPSSKKNPYPALWELPACVNPQRVRHAGSTRGAIIASLPTDHFHEAAMSRGLKASRAVGAADPKGPAGMPGRAFIETAPAKRSNNHRPTATPRACGAKNPTPCRSAAGGR